MSKFRKLAGRITETIVFLLVIFALVEITLRVYNHYNPSLVFEDHSYNRFRGKPGAPDFDFSLNSGGFKDVEFTFEKEAGVYRILALGASFSYGAVPYRYNYLTLLEQQLKSAGHRVEVLNMGIPATGPEHFLALLAHEGLQLKPDMVIVSFFMGNDLTYTRASRRNRILDHFAIPVLIRHVINTIRKFDGNVITGHGTYDDDAPNFTPEAYLDLETRRSLIYLKREPNSSVFAGAVNYLVRIKELCDSNKTALRVVIIPDEVQVNAVLRAQVIKALDASPDEIDFTLPNRFLRAQLSAHRINHIDLLDDFSSAAARVNLYKLRDTHWNIAGNKLAADILTPYFSSQLGR